MKKRSFITKTFIFVLLGIVLFASVQSVFTPTWTTENINLIFSGYEALEQDSVDVLFLGTSHVVYGVSPMKLYEKSNIATYSLATSAQPIECSYYVLKKAFQTQHPKVVFLDASSLFFKEDKDSNAAWRYILDTLPLDAVKLEMSQAYAEEDFSDGFMSAILPITKYHTRWGTLTSADFRRAKPENYYSAGQFICPIVNGSQFSTATVDYVVDKIHTKTEANYADNTMEKYVEDDPVYDPEISDANLEYLLRMKELCDNNGAELVVTKIPTSMAPQFYSSAWTKVKSEILEAVCEENDLRFFDLTYHAKIELNNKKDTCDAGKHLNALGAEKTAEVFAKWLKENFEFDTAENPQYEENLKQYHQIMKIANLQTEMDFADYFAYLKENGDSWTVIITAYEEYTKGLDDTAKEMLLEYGLDLIVDGQDSDSYAAVIHNGKVIYEAVSNREIEKRIAVDDYTVELSSSGWYNKSDCSICIDGKEYALKQRGLNIVVVDNNTDLVIDSAVFDTFDSKKICMHNWDFVNLQLHLYEMEMIS